MFVFSILIPCLICGAFFVVVASWLTTRKGNTIRDILESQKFVDAESIKVEILGKVKLSSTIPIVALYFIAAFVAIALPAFVHWKMMSDVTVITLSGKIEVEDDEKVYPTLQDASILPDGAFKIPIIYSDDKTQGIIFEGQNCLPISLLVTLNKAKGALLVSKSGLEPTQIQIDFDNKLARYEQPIQILSSSLNTNIPNTLSMPLPVDPQFSQINDEPEGVK